MNEKINKIYDRLLYETEINIYNINKEIYIVEASDNMLIITQFEKRFLLFEANNKYIPLINEYIEKNKNNLFIPTNMEANGEELTALCNCSLSMLV